MSSNPQLPRTPFTAAMLAENGVTRHTFRCLLKDGLIRQVTSRVYLAADVELTVELRVQAVALVVKPHQVIADRTAAWIWDIGTYAYGELDYPPIETVALRGSNPCKRADVSGRTRDLHPDEIVTVGGVRVTTPVRTALDLGCVLQRREALAALDAFRRVHGLSLARLEVAVGRFTGRRGVVQLKALLPLSDPRAESARESWTRLAIIDAGLPLPELQIWVEVEGFRYRLDLAYPRQRIVIEYDGWEAHESTEDLRRATRERRERLRRNGWTVIVGRKRDFTGAGLDAWLDEIREALRSAYSSRRPLERGDRERLRSFPVGPATK
jgi:hypothetical protein